jgi:hypothetical protein
MVELGRDFPILEIPIVTSAGARSRDLMAGTMDQGAGTAMMMQHLSDEEARPLPDDDVLSAVAAWIRRDNGLHHELASASTTMMATREWRAQIYARRA